MAGPVIHIVAAVIADAEGRVLVVRKRGSLIFIQPGGKREQGETSLETLARELQEELGVRMDAGTARHLGAFMNIAVNEPGQRVRAETYAVDIEGVPVAGAEIEEIRWVEPGDCAAVPLAPLSRHGIFPAAAAWVKVRDAKIRKARLDEPVTHTITLAIRCLSWPVFVVFVLLALPMVGNLLVISLAHAHGCNTGEDAIHPCAFLVWDIGDLVSGYGLSSFLAGAANPFLAGLALYAFLKSWAGIVWSLLLGSALVMRWRRRRQLLGA
jgi:8-oxo-dGTP pyrophosphatase MutT (NUDIX family)